MASEPLKLMEPWEDAERQQVAAQFGLWMFLATEALFFGGIFLFYAVARYAGGAAFVAGAREADVVFGTINTAVLLTSSLTMAIAERAATSGLRRLARAMLAATAAFGLAFLVIKGFEYRKDITEHLVPGPDFKLPEPRAAQFWAFYWTVTVVHAIHLTIGLGAIGRLLLLDRREDPTARSTAVVGTALYWHLIDVVWVLLYPMLYLVGR